MKEDYTSIIYESLPICPFCRSRITDSEYLISLGVYATENMQDEEVWEAECPNCNKNFWLRVHLTYEYDTNTHEDYI